MSLPTSKGGRGKPKLSKSEKKATKSWSSEILVLRIRGSLILPALLTRLWFPQTAWIPASGFQQQQLMPGLGARHMAPPAGGRPPKTVVSSHAEEK
ncbi:hypothetical protein DVH24_018204 [Malus domestica]|uniref:Uncharacterized protein n=1 Tax=Malus domestica TaxID=3750 RepID=A0A498KKL0_MALDO|nr:hypothetical protein DVH24_018204 [Malus domestica]